MKVCKKVEKVNQTSNYSYRKETNKQTPKDYTILSVPKYVIKCDTLHTTHKLILHEYIVYESKKGGFLPPK